MATGVRAQTQAERLAALEGQQKALNQRVSVLEQQADRTDRAANVAGTFVGNAIVYAAKPVVDLASRALGGGTNK